MMSALHSIRRLVREDDGTVAILFGLSVFITIGVAGAAIDISNTYRVRAKVQEAIDAAVLAATNPLVEENRRQDVFEATFAANYHDAGPAPKPMTYVYEAGKGGKGRATVDMPNYLLGVVGHPRAKFTVESNANYEQVDQEIVLVLDISGSMMGRIDQMKDAAKKLIDTIEANKRAGSSVKYAVVPFNMAVNLGSDNLQFVANTTHPLFGGTEWGGCVLERPNGNHHTDVYNSGATDGTGKWPAYIWPPAPDKGSCLNRSNGTNAGYSSVEPAPLGKDPWMDGPNFNCPRYKVQALTDSASTVQDVIDELQAYGNMGTVIGPAVGWGMRILSPQEPFTEGAPYSRQVEKIMIVLTDGEMVTDGASCSGAVNSTSTYSFDPKSVGLQGKVLTSAPMNDSFTPYGYVLDSNPYNAPMSTALDADKELDRLSVEACAQFKATSPTSELYSIAVSTAAGPGTRAHDVLQACASSSSHFFYAANDSAIMGVFEDIAKRTVKLRLTQ